MSQILHPTFGYCECRTVEVTYVCDVTNPNSKLIPLGAMSDVQITGSSNPIYGLGLIARKVISEDEASLVGRLARDAVSHPFTYLELEFDRIWESANSYEAFTGLTLHPVSALRFDRLSCLKLTIPSNLARHVDEDRDAAKVWALDQLKSARDNAYWALIDRIWGKSPAERDERECAA